MRNFKNPLIIIAIFSALLAITGTYLGWFTLGLEIAAKLGDEGFARLESIVRYVAAISLFSTLAVVATNIRLISIIGVVTALIGAMLIFRQMPTPEEADALQVTTNLGFWFSLGGCIIAAIANLGIVAMGFGANSKKGLPEAK